MQKQIDWDKVFEISKAALNDTTILLPNRRVWFRDCRTVHMGAGRQSGVSSWARTLMVKEPSAIFIEPRSELRDITIPLLENAGIRNAKGRVFTPRDLNAIVNRDPSRFEMLLKDCKLIIINDAQWVGGMSFSEKSEPSNSMVDLLPVDVTIVRIK